MWVGRSATSHRETGGREDGKTHIANPRPRPGVIRLFPIRQACKCLDHFDTLPVVNQRPVGEVVCNGETGSVEFGLEEFAAGHHEDGEKEWGTRANVGYIVQSEIEQIDEWIEFCEHSIAGRTGESALSVMDSSKESQKLIRTVPRARPLSARPGFRP